MFELLEVIDTAYINKYYLDSVEVNLRFLEKQKDTEIKSIVIKPTVEKSHTHDYGVIYDGNWDDFFLHIPDNIFKTVVTLYIYTKEHRR